MHVFHSRRALGVSGLLFGFLLAGRPAKAQLTLPGFLGSQFIPRAPDVGTHLILLQPYSQRTTRAGLTWGYVNELTVHTDKRGEGIVEDLHTNGRWASLETKLGHASTSPLLAVSWQGFGNGGRLNESGTQLKLYGHLDAPQARLIFPLRSGQTFYAGYSRLTYAASGTTNLYRNLFTIFRTNPPFQLRQQMGLATVGMTGKIAPSWNAEVQIGHETSPGFLSLQATQNANLLRLPLNQNGDTSAVAVRCRMSAHSSAVAFGSQGYFQGTDSVRREQGRAIGEATTTRRETAIGLGWQRDLSSSRSLSLHFLRTRSRWDTNGRIPNPGDVTSRFPSAANLNYHAGYREGEETWGLTWERRMPAAHTLDIGYDYAILSGHLAADYRARLLILPVSSQSSQDESGWRCHLLHAAYSFPVSGLTNEITVNQAVPAAIRLGGSGGGRRNPSARTTYGGWTLSWSVSHSF